MSTTSSKTRKNLVFAFSIVAISAAWGLAIVRTCWFVGDGMIGFKLPIFLGLPFAASVLISGWMLAGARHSSLIAVGSFLGIACVLTPFFSMHRITQFAWNQALEKFSDVNQSTLENTDFLRAEFDSTDYPDVHAMVSVDGFKWYCEQHAAAPNGNFRGFALNSIRHVYLNKIRHGYRGVAWVPDPEMIVVSPVYDYRPTGVDHWYVWTAGL